MAEKYILEVYSPDAREDVCCVIKSDEPFMAISVGDFIRPSVWDMPEVSSEKRLQVTEIEHILWKVSESTPSKHKVCVFTTEVDWWD